MIGTILEAEEYYTINNSKRCRKMKVEIDGDAKYIFVTLEAPFLFNFFLKWCSIPLSDRQDDDINLVILSKLRGKIVPIEEILFNDKSVHCLNSKALFRIGE